MNYVFAINLEVLASFFRSAKMLEKKVILGNFKNLSFTLGQKEEIEWKYLVQLCVVVLGGL